MRRLLPLGFIALIYACAQETGNSNEEPINVPSIKIDCGDIIELRVVSELFSRLGEVAQAEEFADQDRDLFRFPLIIESGDDFTSISFEQLKEDTQNFMNFEDLRQISTMRPEDVQSGGYRGCFLARGKVWFELPVDGDNLQIVSFDRDMEW